LTGFAPIYKKPGRFNGACTAIDASEATKAGVVSWAIHVDGRVPDHSVVAVVVVAPKH